jgi:hypothetical protein
VGWGVTAVEASVGLGVTVLPSGVGVSSEGVAEGDAVRVGVGVSVVLAGALGVGEGSVAVGVALGCRVGVAEGAGVAVGGGTVGRAAVGWVVAEGRVVTVGNRVGVAVLCSDRATVADGAGEGSTVLGLR